MTKARRIAVLLAGVIATLLLMTVVPAHAIPGIPDKRKCDPASITPDPNCEGVVSSITGAVGSVLENTVVKAMADELAQFTKELIRTGLGWWLTSSSIRLGDTGVVSDPATSHALSVSVGLQGICVGIGMLIAVFLLVFAAIKTMIQRKGVHLLQAFQGLVVNALVVGLGITVIDGSLVASDALAEAILGVAFKDKGSDQIAGLMVGVLISSAWSPTVLLVLSLIVLLIGVAQLCMVFLRQAALPIQALLLPIAGAGQLGGPRAREWLPRLYTSIFAVIAYKPLAALLIGVGFVELNSGASFLDWVRGVVTLVLSVLALPALMQIFSPLGVTMAGATAGGGFLPAMLQAAAYLASGRGGGGGQGPATNATAVQHAAQMAKTGPAATASAALPALAAAHTARAALSSAAGVMSGHGGSGSAPPPVPASRNGDRPPGDQGNGPPAPARPSPAPGDQAAGSVGGQAPEVSGLPGPRPSGPSGPGSSGPGSSGPGTSPPRTSPMPPPGVVPPPDQPTQPGSGVPAGVGPVPGASASPSVPAAPADPAGVPRPSEVASPGPAQTPQGPTSAPDGKEPTGAEAWTRYGRRPSDGGPPPQTWPGK